MDRWGFVVLCAGGFWLAAGQAHGQAAPELRSSLDEAVLSQPTLTISEVEEVPAATPKKTDAIDPYAPQGIRLGGIILHPSLTIGSVYSSNVLQSSSNADSAAGANIRPALSFESDWVRHSWTGSANFNLKRYLDNGDIKSRSGEAATKYRLDIRHSTRAEFEASYGLDQTGLGNSEVPLNAVGYQTQHIAAGSTAFIHDFGPLEARIRAGAGWHVYSDVDLSGGGTEDNSDRDYIEPLLSIRATYTEAPVFKPYLQASYVPRLYQKKHDRNGLKRSSQGYGAAAGLQIDNGPLWSGDIALTYLRREYDDAGLNDNSAVGLIGSLTWSPTELTTVVLGLGTSISDSLSSTASSYRNWSGQLDLVYALRDNVDVLAGAGVTLQKGGSTDDVTYDLSFGVDWTINPTLAWTAGYDFAWLNAATSNRSYTEHQVSVGLTLSR